MSSGGAMSLSSTAEESALRLVASAAPTAQSVANAAAQAVLVAKSGGASDDVAMESGAAAGEAVEGEGKPEVSPSPLSLLTKYIPTETITLYVALTAAVGDVTVPA